MQYILTEEEYKAFVPRALLERAMEGIFSLRKKLLAAEGVVCIHDDKADIYATCDDCPVGGPRNDWSIDSKIFCGLSKNYSK